MKQNLNQFLLLLSVVGLFSSCRESSRLPAPQLSGTVPLIAPQISSDPNKNHFDYTRTRSSVNALANLSNPTRPVFEFSFDLDNTRDKKVKAVEVYKSLLTGASFAGSVFTGGGFSARVLVGTYTSFPVSISLNSQDALTGLQRLIPQTGTTPPALALPYLLTVKAATAQQPNLLSVQRGTDAIVFTFEYILDDDSRVILTPITKASVVDNINGTVAKTVDVLLSTTQVNFPYAAVAVIRD